ncbi:MAG: DNA repair protein RadC [Acidobacteria bacterium]|nr:DNA repair protein RadC [Acidobacteriota bacterium]
MGRPSEAAALLRARLESEPIEVCVVLLLNTKHRVVSLHEVSRGTLDSCIVHPRDVFKAAIMANAAGVIVGHNHPSGDPEPSPDDVALCLRLRRAAEIIGIDLLDFVIIGEGGRYYSFKETGR